MDKVIKHYSQNHKTYLEAYESVSPEQIHQDWLHLIPTTKSLILDIGAGSGRDAAWLTSLGHEVVAVEPAEQLRESAQKLHPNPTINWLNDSLPALSKTYKLDLKFDLILVCAVWMHLPLTKRERAFRKLTNLLKPGGKLIISLRHGPVPDGREMYDCSIAELIKFAKQFMLDVQLEKKSEDHLGRPEISWTVVAFSMPDDGTGALPLLRHIIINDSKSSTYKLALLRVLTRIADGSQGMVLAKDKDFVTLPFGLVALFWVKVFLKPLLNKKLPQQPHGVNNAFAKDAFKALKNVSPYDLRVGCRFSGDTGKNLSRAIKEARNTIKDMPAHFTTLPNSDNPVFPCEKSRVVAGNDINLDIDFLSSFGTFNVPRNLWDSMTRYACWIEPAIINEWCNKMASLDKKAKITRPMNEYLDSLTWLDQERNTSEVRSIIESVKAKGKSVYCVWSGDKLHRSFSVDHCFPFSAWPNNDLWNLLPTKKTVNSNKSNKLISARVLEKSRDRILDWYANGYEIMYSNRFYNEANAALPMIDGGKESISLEKIISGIHRQRIRLKVDQQLSEWDGVVK